MSPDGLAKLIMADQSGDFSNGSGLVVSRTESGTAINVTSVLGYRVSACVQEVRIFDAPDCGWTSHNDPGKADGSVRSLEDAEAYPLSHPNCVRGWAPVVTTEVAP